MPRNFLALPGFYQALFLYLEPLLTISPAFVVWFWPGPEWFHNQLIPESTLPGALDARTTMAMWQLGNCYMLLALTSSFVFRAIRDNCLTILRLRNVSWAPASLRFAWRMWATSWVGLPEDLRYSFWSWNTMTQGNITFCVFILGMRLAWFAGIGRQRYYYGKAAPKNQKSA
ncbi:hypothetical protein HD554DRAFT_2173839 [Boletus coccyginus]|nr:hypothetical protein HD554DRAFT_2173839 [Boletus coccyginus]